MELFLRWLDEHERRPNEETPRGLIQCQAADTEQVELLRLAKSGMRVAEYMTELPSHVLLQSKLHQALEIAHCRQFSLAEGAEGGFAPVSFPLRRLRLTARHKIASDNPGLRRLRFGVSIVWPLSMK